VTAAERDGRDSSTGCTRRRAGDDSWRVRNARRPTDRRHFSVGAASRSSTDAGRSGTTRARGGRRAERTDGHSTQDPPRAALVQRVSSGRSSDYLRHARHDHRGDCRRRQGRGDWRPSDVQVPPVNWTHPDAYYMLSLFLSLSVVSTPTIRSESALERLRRSLSSSLASPGPKIRRASTCPSD
jgi:hypothetical protein